MTGLGRTATLAAFALLIAACQSTPASPSPVPVSSSPLAPTRTAAPIPTHVPTATLPGAPTALPTPAPRPTTTPQGQIGPYEFPAGVNPLTGEVMKDPSALDRRPLAVKVSNAPPCVRPQAGLSAADLVFEHFAEGGTTRFTAIFYGRSPGRVGSVRSARFIDLELPAMYDSLFAFAGASIGVTQRVNRSDFKDRIITPYEGCPPFCRVPLETTACGLTEHTLFADTDDLWAVASERGVNVRPNLGGMVFNETPPGGGKPVDEIVAAYTASFVQWLYDASRGTYYRRQDGASHADANTGLPITADNVVVVFVNHIVTDVIEDKVGYNLQTGEGGNYSIQIQLWGEGPAYLFRDGQVFPGRWVRFERDGELGIVTDTDHYLAFKPGNTWFQVVPFDSPVIVEGGQWRVNPTRPPRTPWGLSLHFPLQYDTLRALRRL